jgi:hypothetical protein
MLQPATQARGHPAYKTSGYASPQGARRVAGCSYDDAPLRTALRIASFANRQGDKDALRSVARLRPVDAAIRESLLPEHPLIG